MKKVLLTGATGFIGRQTIPFLLEKGYEVHVVVRNKQSFPEEVQVHHLDLFDENLIHQTLKNIKPSHLLHFAWYAVHGKFWQAETNLDWVRSSLKLVQSFVANGGKRILVSGTCAEYEWGPSTCDEFSTPLKSSFLYGVSKASLYQLLESYARTQKISFAWGRIFFLYGPHEIKERLVPSIIQKLIKGDMAPCSHGNQIRDFMHVEDVANAFVTLLDSHVEGAINIASGINVTLKQIIDSIAFKLNALEKVQYGFYPAPNDPPIISANVTRLFNELKWAPKYTLEKGLNQTIDWWKQQLQM